MGVKLVQAIFLVEDLEKASAAMRVQGLDVIDGGRHQGRGTANMIVPLGDQYLELLTVVDEQEADGSPMGRPVLEALKSRGEGLARWSVQASDLDGIAERVGLDVQHRHRTLPSGEIVRWHSVGVDEAWAEPWRCAFMAWDEEVRHPGRMPHRHPCQADGIASIEIGVPDWFELADWLGESVPAEVRPVAQTTLGPTGLVLRTASGELVELGASCAQAPGS